ncbi:MAG: M43 family zinc metalloprotease [Chitinophagales bacterium]|nr:M43 family zinc metalloprotease [Chitinophagales bacterium]
MKYFLLLFMAISSINVYAQRSCGSHTLYEHLLQNNPDVQVKERQIEDFTQEYIKSHPYSRMAADEIIIPVVFHVVYHTNAPKQNVGDVTIFEQMEILNNDFNGLNADISKVPDPFKPYIGNFKIRFVLANRDPQGNPTNGIIRLATTRTDFNILNNNIKKADKGGSAAWDTKSYLNIWVGDVKDEANKPGLLGYATFPSSAGTALDGVVISYSALGKTGAISPYNLGRTATHEVGHYFNLRHIWGDADNCTADDGIGDTPQQYKASSGNPTFPKTDQCTKGDGIMFMNYMDYSFDKSLIMFTLEQANRMSAALNGPRKGLKTSKGYVDETPKSAIDLQLQKIVYPDKNFCSGEANPIVLVKSLGSNTVNNFTVSMSVNNVPTQEKSWSGVLNFSDSTFIIFNPINFQEGTYNITYTVSINGDEKPENNSLSQIVTVKGATALPYSENFESLIFNNGTTINNPDAKITWARSSQGISTLGNYSYFMNNYEYNPVELGVGYGEKDDIILPNLNFANHTNVSLTFDLAAAQYTNVMTSDNNWDSLQVLISTDCGKSFNILYNKYAGSLVTVASPKTTFFTPTPAQWRTETINLGAYDGQDAVRLMIRNISNFENNIYIDNLKISGDVVTGIKDFSSSAQMSIYPNPSTGKVTVRMENLSSKLKAIEWVNMMGQTISMDMQNNVGNTLSFDFSKQTKGLYIAKFLFEDGSVKTEKLLLQ